MSAGAPNVGVYSSTPPSTAPAWAVRIVGGGGSGLPVIPAAATIATRSSVAASLASVTLLAANTSRRGAQICNNDPAATLYVCLGASAATVASAAYQVAPGDTIPIPDQHTYEIRGIWAGAAVTGNAAITEET